jgi:hypothetical protein
MKVRIHHEPSEDSIIVYGDTMDDLLDNVDIELQKRGWDGDDCWSEHLDSEN